MLVLYRFAQGFSKRSRTHSIFRLVPQCVFLTAVSKELLFNNSVNLEGCYKVLLGSR